MRVGPFIHMIHNLLKLHCLFARPSVCAHPLFRYDRLTATKFGTYMRIDPGIMNKPHPTRAVEVLEDTMANLLYLLMPVYSMGAWAIDQSSPPDPALRHGCNFLPGVPHLPRFRLHVSPPGVSWPSSFPLSLGIPCQGLSCDARCRKMAKVREIS